MGEFNIQARLGIQQQPFGLQESVEPKKGKRKIAQLVGKTGTTEVFTALLGKGKVAKNHKIPQRLNFGNAQILGLPPI